MMTPAVVFWRFAPFDIRLFFVIGRIQISVFPGRVPKKPIIPLVLTLDPAGGGKVEFLMKWSENAGILANFMDLQ